MQKKKIIEVSISAKKPDNIDEALVKIIQQLEIKQENDESDEGDGKIIKNGRHNEKEFSYAPIANLSGLLNGITLLHFHSYFKRYLIIILLYFFFIFYSMILFLTIFQIFS